MIFEFKGIEHWEYFERYAYKGEGFDSIWHDIRQKAMEYDEPVRSAVDVLIRIAEKVHERLGTSSKFYKDVLGVLSKFSKSKKDTIGSGKDESIEDFEDFDYKVLQLFKVEFQKKFSISTKKAPKKSYSKIDQGTKTDQVTKNYLGSGGDSSDQTFGDLIQKSLQDIINNAKGIG